jgi:hypothetical protein
MCQRLKALSQLPDKANFRSGLKATKIIAPECRLEECVVFVVCCLRFTAVTQSPERKMILIVAGSHCQLIPGLHTKSNH